MDEKEAWKFTCKECGGHSLVVTHVWNILAGANSERWQEWGPLKDNHHWQYEFKERVGDKSEDEVQMGNLSDFEEDDSTSEPEEYEIHEREDDRESDEFYVNCEGCDREIEFGWEQPDRHGLIFPVEFTDFTPSESWPDPKYLDIWRHRGWARVENIRP